MTSKDRHGDSGSFYFFFRPRWHPNSPPRPGEAPHPRPLCQKICYSDCTENCPLRPLRAPRRFRNPKIRQQLGAQPTPMFRVMLDALLDALLDAMIDPLPPFTFCCPQAIVDQDAGVSIPNLISLLPLDEAPVHVHRFAARAPCDSKGSECQCGIQTGEAASALRSRKTERAAKEKPTPISHFFLAPAAPRGDHPREVVTRRVPCPRPSAQFQSMLFKSNKLLATEGSRNPNNLAVLRDRRRKPRQVCFQIGRASC